jgi:hypothetical protein
MANSPTDFPVSEDEPNVVPITPVASRMFMVYESSFFIGEDWVPQEEEEIGLLEVRR